MNKKLSLFLISLMINAFLSSNLAYSSNASLRVPNAFQDETRNLPIKFRKAIDSGKEIRLRDETRRDGVAVNFLLDDQMMQLLARALPPGTIFTIGYPSICSAERRRVRKILEKLADLDIEPAVYSHALEAHLELSGSLIAGYSRASATFWMPISDEFIGRTLRTSAEEVMRGAIKLVLNFKRKFPNNLDVALADTTNDEPGLIKRVAWFTGELHKAGARSVIICDTKGVGTGEHLRQLFQEIRGVTTGSLEFHPHNDNGQAISNIEVARLYGGVDIINTALYGASERGTMVDPRELIRVGYEIDFQPRPFEEFEREYRATIGDPDKAIQLLYGKDIVVTGSQFRLWGRPGNAQFIFGVTSDKFILAKMLEVEQGVITNEMLGALKNYLYDTRKLYLTKEELLETTREIFGESTLKALLSNLPRTEL